ncbi:MAG: ATP-binding protein, partial [Desulfobacterales bacterium]|nr:ATP-binding protein [Desulfobacterales bacterium]
MGKENDLLKKLKSTFKLEAEERLKAFSSSLLRLEESPPDEERKTIVESIYREAHSLKGAARAVGLTDIEAVCQSLESVISALKRGSIATSPEMYDTFYRVIDAVGAALPAKEGEDIALGRDKVAKLEQDLDALIAPGRGEPKQKEEAPAAPEAGERKGYPLLAPALSETVRISTGKLESLMLQVEELMTLKIAAGQRTAEFREIQSALSGLKKKLAHDLQDVEKDIGVGPVLEAFSETREYVGSLEKELGELARSSDLDRRTAAGMVDGLLDDVKKVLMLPFSSLLEVFPRMVRDLSRDQGKEVKLVVKGDEVEIDRRILEEMKDPLIHLVRNCVDHGIERPEERERAGKPRAGTVSLEVSQIEGDKVRIAVIDDGAGSDTEKIKESAVRAGIITSEEAGRLSESESRSLMFRSDLSTSAIVTEVSGRGLGLAIVHETVERLGGNIAVETDRGGGTRFELVVPITITTFRGILVRAAGQDFIVPTAGVERVVRIKRDYVRTVENAETISLDGQTVPLVRLAEI